MATQPNAGRDIESDILRVLAERTEMSGLGFRRHVGGTPRIVMNMVIHMERTGMLAVRSDAHGRRHWSLADRGHRVAEARGLARRGEG